MFEEKQTKKSSLYCCCCLVAKLCLTLYNPMTVACQASLSMGSSSKKLEGAAISFSRGSWRSWFNSTD